MSAQTVFSQTSQPITTNGDSGSLSVGNFLELAIDVNITGNQGTSPTIQFFLERLGVDGIWYPVYQSSVISSSSAQVQASVGAGLSTSQSFGGTVRFRRTIGGSATPGFTYSVSIQGK